MKTGLHSFGKSDYVKLNNMLYLTNTHKISNKYYVNFIKDITKNRMNPVEALKNISPYKNVHNPSLKGNEFAEKLMKNQFNNIDGLKQFQELKKLPKGQQIKKGINIFTTELLGEGTVASITKAGKVMENTVKESLWDSTEFAGNTMKKVSNLKIKDFSSYLIKGSKEKLKGIKQSVDKSTKNFKALNTLGKATKIAGPIGTGLTIVDNYNQHKDNPQKLVVSTAVDLGGAATAAAAGAVVGSFIVPPIGTTVGAVVGVVASAGLNSKWGKPPKSILDHTKDGVNKTIDKVASWFK